MTPHISCAMANARLMVVMPSPVELSSGEMKSPNDCLVPIVTMRMAAAASVIAHAPRLLPVGMSSALLAQCLLARGNDAGGSDEGWSRSACLTHLTHFWSPVARDSILAPTMAAKVDTSLSREISLSWPLGAIPSDAIAVKVSKICSPPALYPPFNP